MDGTRPRGRILRGDRDRIAACKLLGMTAISSMVLPISGLQSDLAEIDENLVRDELSPLERGEHLARRKAIYEAIHPETRHGGSPGNLGVRRGKGIKDADSASLLPFAADTSAKTGISIRSVQSDVQIADGIVEPVKEMIRGTPVAEDKSAPLEIARSTPSDQPSAARLALERKASPRPRKRHAEPHPDPGNHESSPGPTSGRKADEPYPSPSR